MPVFNYLRAGGARNVPRVPGRWFVYDATPWAPRKVMLFVGPGRTQPPMGVPRPVSSGAPEPVSSGVPAPSPSPAG